MSNNDTSEKRATCVAKFKPIILISAVAIVAVTGWVLLQASTGTCVRGFGRGPGGGVLAATAPPITANAAAPHPDFGKCTRCHDVQAPGVAATNGKMGVVPAAAAPPIAANAKLTHPPWGPCKKCHAITGTSGAGNGPANGKGTAASATPAAVLVPTAPDAMLGTRMEDLTDGVANRLDMEVKKGAIVTQVLDNSVAAAAGLKVDDVVLKVNDAAVTSVAELRAALAGLDPGSKVKLQVARGEANKNIFVRLPNVVAPVDVSASAAPPAAAAPAPQPAAFVATPVPGRVAIAATSATEDAQVAPVFSDAPVFLVRDGPASQWLTTRNPFDGQARRGQAVAELLVQHGVSAVIAGNIGAGAFQTLLRAGVRVYSGAFGGAASVYEQYLADGLVPATRTVVPVAARPVATGMVAVASMGASLSSPVCPNLASAPYFVFFDLVTRTPVAMRNPTLGDEALGSLPLVQFLADRGATAIIAGNTNSSTLAMLNRYGIMGFFGVEGKVEEAINMYAAGAFQGATLPTVAANAPQ
jgi:predicted Fe-Mo cluster-binding NifX family protein